MRGLLTLSSFISVIFFPWPFTVFLAIIASGTEPLVPIAVCIFADTLYYVPSAGSLPLFTLFGAVFSAVAFFVRTRLKTGNIL